MQVTGTMTWVSAGPAGVFAINGANIYFLQNSRGVAIPSSELVSEATWIQVFLNLINNLLLCDEKCCFH